MGWRLWFAVLSLVACMCPLAVPSAQTAPTPQPEGTLTVAVATFGNERWLPELYPGAEDVVLKPMMENLLSRDVQTGQLIPMLAERWEVLDGGRAWKFFEHIRGTASSMKRWSTIGVLHRSLSGWCS